MPPEAGNAGWWAGSQAEPGRDKQRQAARQSQAVGRARQPGTVRHQSDQRRPEPGAASQPARQSQTARQTARQPDRQTQTVSEPGRLRQSQTPSQTDPSVSHQLLSVVRITRCKGPCTSCLSFGCRLLG